MNTFLKLKLLCIWTTLGCCLSLPVLDRQNVTAEAKVLILGAGMAGISAVQALKEEGIEDFIILEGSDRIGGRLKEVNFAGYTVPLGAAWIQGTYKADKPHNNPVLDLALKYNLSFTDSLYDDWTVRDASGTNVTEDADNLYEDFYTAYEASQNLGRLMQTSEPDIFKDDMSLEGAFRKYGWAPETPVEQVIENFDVDMENGQQSDISSTRYSYDWSRFDFQDEDLLVTQQGERGFSKIAKDLLSDLISENDSRKRLYLNQYVTEIAHDEEGVVVTTAAGERYMAEYVIVTFSLGVLQRDVVKFKPQLPEWKTDSIHAFLMSLYTHFYLKFPDNSSVFWDDSQFILYASKTRGYFSIWQNFDKQTIPGSRILQCTIISDVAEDLHYLTDLEIQNKALDVLRIMYGNNVTEPEVILFPRWKNDPYTFGSFSDWPTGYTQDQHDALKASVGRVHFAGEAFHQRYFAYVQGAIESGRDTSKVVASCLNDGECQDEFVPRYNARGCTYFSALNYKKGAKEDDGSCRFAVSTAAANNKKFTFIVFFAALLNVVSHVK